MELDFCLLWGFIMKASTAGVIVLLLINVLVASYTVAAIKGRRNEAN